MSRTGMLRAGMSRGIYEKAKICNIDFLYTDYLAAPMLLCVDAVCLLKILKPFRKKPYLYSEKRFSDIFKGREDKDG